MESHNVDLSNLYATQAATTTSNNTNISASSVNTATPTASYLPLLNYSLYSNIDDQTSTQQQTQTNNDENNPLYANQSLNTNLDNCKKLDINHLLSQIMPITDQDLKDCEKKY